MVNWPDDYLIPGIEPYHQEEAGIIYCGDSLKLLPKFKPKTFNSAITDPPFGIDFKRYLSHEDDPNKYDLFIKQIINEINNLVSGSCFVWQTMKTCHQWHKWFPIPYRIFAGLKNFSQFRPTLIQYSWDPIIFWTNGNIKKGIAGNRDYHLGNTSKYVAEKSCGHPCPRPYNTVEYIIQIATNNKDIILDPFLGSGTTAVAAKELGRRFIGIEIEEKYCAIAVKRLRQGVLKF